MNLIVCVKRVPDSAARIRIAGDGESIESEGVKYVLNPYDEFALEEALRLREAAGTGTVGVLSVGPPETTETLRSALAMGADEACLLKTPLPLGETMDGRTVARVLAEELRGREFDLLLFGKQAIDDDNAQVPAMVAEMLGLPCATVVVELRLEEGHAVARREVEGGHERVEFDLPGVVSAQKGLNEPRYPSLKGIMAAKRKPLEEKDVQLQPGGIEMLGLEEPPASKGGEILGEGVEAVPELVRRLREEAKVL